MAVAFQLGLGLVGLYILYLSVKWDQSAVRNDIGGMAAS